MQWHTQAYNIANNIMVEVHFTLPALITTNVVTCECHVYEYSKGRYDLILGRDL